MDIVASSSGRDVTDLENRLVSDLCTLQHDEERATENFATAAETYVRYMMDGAKRRKRLLMDYIESKEARQETKQVREVQTPYVVVLLDGNCVYFKDNFIRGNGDGGLKAAHCLKAAVTKYILNTATVPKDSRIVVRIYADLQALSFSAGIAGLISKKNEPRALAPFAFRFSQVSPFFDFTDVGDRQSVNTKIIENFKIFSDDPQCKLLLFGVGMSLAYLNILSSYRGHNKVVLLPTGSLHKAFGDLGLKAVHFEEVFRFTDLSYQHPGLSNKKKITPSSMNRKVSQITGTRIKQSPEICYEFRGNGVCSRQRCHFDHTPIAKVPSYSSISYKKSKFASNIYNLPNSGKPGFIPVNANNDRIDVWMPPPTEIEWAIYQDRAKAKKPCNAHYLRECCDNAYCQFDHEPLPPAGHYCLEFINKELPCKKEGRCRLLDCEKGHICQRPGCSTSRSNGCKMPDRAHEVDRKVTQWVKPGGGSNQNSSGHMSTKSSTVVGKSGTFAGPRSASAGILSDNLSSNWRNNDLSRSVFVGDWDQSDWIPNTNVIDPTLVKKWGNAGYNPLDVPRLVIPALAQPLEKIPWSANAGPIRSGRTKLSGNTIEKVAIEHWEATMNQKQGKQNENVPVKKCIHAKEFFNMDYPLIDLSEE